MATTSIWKVEGRLDHVIDYVMDEKKMIALRQVLEYATDESKTIDHQYVTCINCMQKNPYQSMINTKQQFQDKKRIVCFHGYQSFTEGEVTPELAHQIGIELAEKLWGDRYEVVVSTHLNTDNIHNHFVLNATSCVNGKRYCNTKKDLYNLRMVSDDLCRKYGLSIVEEKAYQSKGRNQYYHDKALIVSIKQDIYEAIKVSLTRTAFLNQLAFEGYEIIQEGNSIALRHPAHEKFVTLARLGNGYQQNDIDQKILGHFKSAPNRTIYEKKGFDIVPYFQRYQKNQLKGLQKLYIHYQFKLGILPKRNNTRPKYSKELKEAIRKLEDISNQTILLCKNSIETLEHLNQHQTLLQEQLNDFTSKRLQCRNKIRRCSESALKEQFKAEAKSYTPQIKKLRKEVQLCDGIRERSTRIQQFEFNEKLMKTEKGKTRT